MKITNYEEMGSNQSAFSKYFYNLGRAICGKYQELPQLEKGEEFEYGGVVLTAAYPHIEPYLKAVNDSAKYRFWVDQFREQKTIDLKSFTLTDMPNFFGSGYSTVKGYTDQVLRHFNNTLQLRIRMPVSKLVSGRNLIDKLVGYPNICSIPNSMTVLDDMWPIIDKMIEVREKGVYNLTNPGTAEHNWILQEYTKLINQNHMWNLMSYEEQMKYIKSERSNNEIQSRNLFCVVFSVVTLKGLINSYSHSILIVQGYLIKQKSRQVLSCP